MKAVLSTTNRGMAEDLECILYEYNMNFTLQETGNEYIYTVEASRCELDSLIENEINKTQFKIKL